MMIAMALLLMCLPATAETKNDGLLSVTVAANGKFDPKGITLAAYLVATGDYGEWTMQDYCRDVEIFTGTDGATKINQSLSTLTDRIKARGIKSAQTASTDANGKASFSGLQHGIYLVQMTKGPDGLTLSPMLLATPNRDGAVQIAANAKFTYNVTTKTTTTVTKLTVTTQKNERLVNIDEYETALGLGNIQMNSGVCFE